MTLYGCVSIMCNCEYTCRLLGTLSLSLQEVVLRGSQNVSSALKSKLGEIMVVCVCVRERAGGGGEEE